MSIDLHIHAILADLHNKYRKTSIKRRVSKQLRPLEATQLSEYISTVPSIHYVIATRIVLTQRILCWIIIGSDRRPETKQGIEGKIDRFRSGRVRVRVRDRDGL